MFENETMTIKRLEVAIRNRDVALLKEATYKLHEKYHAGFDFKMLEELKNIANEAKQTNMPLDILEILCPTIDEILEGKNVFGNNFSQEIHTEPAYSAPIANEYENHEVEIYEENYANDSANDSDSAHFAIFFDDNTYNYKDSIFAQYKTKLSLIAHDNKNAYCSDILDDISNIIEFSSKNVDGLARLVAKIANFDSNFSFVTSSINPYLTPCFKRNEIAFSIPCVSEVDKSGANFLPLFGLSNLFVCPKCGNLSLNDTKDVLPVSIKCDKCHDISYIDVSGAFSNKANIKLDYYNHAILSFAKSNVWIMVNPPNDSDSAIFDMFYMLSLIAKPKMIFLLEDGNIYHNLFAKYLSDTKIISSQTTIDELLENLQSCNRVTA